MKRDEFDADPNPLVDELLEKSRQGQLDWQPTADRQAFVASVGGDTTFQITLFTSSGVGDYGQQETFEEPRLDMLDERGKLLWRIADSQVEGRKLWNLFTVARRIGNKIDDRVSRVLSSLNPSKRGGL